MCVMLKDVISAMELRVHCISILS